MTTEELIAAIRVRLDDVYTSDPPRVSDDTIIEQASLTQTEFARATLVLFEEAEADVEADVAWVDIPSNFCVLKSAILNGSQLRPITTSELDFGYYSFNNNIENSGRFANWRAATGVPMFLVVDMFPDKARLVPYSTTGITISLEGYIIPPALALEIPAVPPGDPTPAVNPVIPEMYHELLLVGTLMRLFVLFDIDVFNSEKAQVYSTQWYQGLIEAQNNLRTSLRRQVRIMDLPRGFSFDMPKTQQPAGTNAQ